jgi:hypothetical protein
MGMERVVSLEGEAPPWQAVADLLAQHGYATQLRMIDGELAFPDETLPASWRELRFGTPQGMVTLRREPGRLLLVTWGNADAPLRQAWNALTWACAAVSGGRVLTDDGPVAADDFRRDADLPPEFRG